MTIFFLHIPKVGGTTISSVLTMQYGRSHIYDTTEADGVDFTKLSALEQSRFKLVRGHYYFGLHGDQAKAFQYITFLRDPIARLMSLYYHDKHSENGIYHAEANEMDAFEFFDAGFYGREVNNGQAARIAGFKGVNGIAPVDVLDTALDNIDNHFAAVGLLEHFDESILLFSDALKWRIPPVYARAMVNSKRSRAGVLDPRLEGFLFDNTEADRALFSEIMTRNRLYFEKPRTVRRVRIVRRLSNVVSPLIRLRRKFRG